MANYIFSYDLNGDEPTHGEMDEHIQGSPWSTGRLLETVWYIGADDTLQNVDAYLTSILSPNDSYMLVEAVNMKFEHLLVDEASLKSAWLGHA